MIRVEDAIKLNFLSIVTLGRFNPAILTPDFLRQACGFTSQSEPSGQTTPVVSLISYGDLQFYADMNKLQVKLDNPGSLEKPQFIPVVRKYLDVLKYTPLEKVGVNANADIGLGSPETYQTSSCLESIRMVNEKLANVQSFKTALGYANGESPQLQGCEISWYWAPFCTLRLELNRKSQTAFVANLNFEVSGLEEERSRFGLIEEHYEAICHVFADVTSHLETR